MLAKLTVLFYLLACPSALVPHKATEDQWAALKEFALDLELVGPHERWVSDFASETKYVRTYAFALLDVPSIQDASRLPTIDVAADCCRFSEQYQAHLQNQLLLTPSRAVKIGEVLDEARLLYRVWGAVRRAGNEEEGWVLRRRALERLRDLVGDERFATGQLLPCVPVWRFQEMP